MPKGCRNGGKINARTGQKSMQKQVAKHMWKITINRGILMYETMQIRYTVVKNQGLARWVRGLGKSSKNNETNAKMHPQTYENSMQNLCPEK